MVQVEEGQDQSVYPIDSTYSTARSYNSYLSCLDARLRISFVTVFQVDCLQVHSLRSSAAVSSLLYMYSTLRRCVLLTGSSNDEQHIMALPIVNQEHHSTMIAHGIIHTTAGANDQKRSPSLHERNQNSSIMLNPHHWLGPCHADSLCLATTDRSYSTQEHLVPLYPVYHHMWSALLILVPASTGSLVQTRPETGALSSEPNWCTHPLKFSRVSRHHITRRSWQACHVTYCSFMSIKFECGFIIRPEKQRSERAISYGGTIFTSVQDPKYGG